MPNRYYLCTTNSSHTDLGRILVNKSANLNTEALKSDTIKNTEERRNANNRVIDYYY